MGPRLPGGGGGAGTKARPGVGVFERQVKWPPHPPNRKKLSICSEIETCCCDVACSTSTHYTGMILGDGGPQETQEETLPPWPDWGFGARRFTIRGLSERHGFYWELGVLGALSGDQNIKNGLNVK